MDVGGLTVRGLDKQVEKYSPPLASYSTRAPEALPHLFSSIYGIGQVLIQDLDVDGTEIVEDIHTNIYYEAN